APKTQTATTGRGFVFPILLLEKLARHRTQEPTPKTLLKSPLTLGLTLLTPPPVHRSGANMQITAAQAVTTERMAQRSREKGREVNSFQKNRRSLVVGKNGIRRVRYLSHKELGDEQLFHW